MPLPQTEKKRKRKKRSDGGHSPTSAQARGNIRPPGRAGTCSGTASPSPPRGAAPQTTCARCSFPLPLPAGLPDEGMAPASRHRPLRPTNLPLSVTAFHPSSIPTHHPATTSVPGPRAPLVPLGQADHRTSTSQRAPARPDATSLGGRGVRASGRHSRLAKPRTGSSGLTTPLFAARSHGRREAGGRVIPSRRRPRPRPAVRAAPPPPPRRRTRPARGVGRQRRPRPRPERRPGGGGGGRGAGAVAEGRVRARGEEGVGAADLPGGRAHVQPRDHLHGRRRRLLPLRLANGGRRDSGDGDAGHLRTVRGRGGRHGVLGEVGAPRALARVAVAHARVASPATRRAVRAQRRVRHHQRRAGHVPPRLRLLQPRPRPRPLLRRRPRDHAVRDGLHVRPRRPGPPPLPRGPHRERALLPASRRRPFDPSHGQVRQRAIWAVPRSQGAGGGWRDGGAGEGGPEEDQEERQVTSYAMRRILFFLFLPALKYVSLFCCDCGLDLVRITSLARKWERGVRVGPWSTLYSVLLLLSLLYRAADCSETVICTVVKKCFVYYRHSECVI